MKKKLSEVREREKAKEEEEPERDRGITEKDLFILI